jgi:hypothetical protein
MHGVDPDLVVRADGAGRRGEVDRRSFIRMGVVGAAMASAALMESDTPAGAAMLHQSASTV